MPTKAHNLVIACAFLLVRAGFAQPCATTLGPDVTICAGQTANLNLPAGFPTYLWSTGASTQGLTTGIAGTYWGQVSYPSGNVVTNGNFNAGNTGFSSSFTYSSNLQAEGNYYIGTSAITYHPQWNCTGNGNFLMVNAGTPQAWWTFWEQGMPVCPEQTYTLSFRMANLANTGPATVEWVVDWAYNVGTVTASSTQGQWNTYNTTITTNPGQTWLNLSLRVISGWGVGNDFGIDDIIVSGTMVLRDTVQVNVTPLPVVNLGPPATTLCAGQTLNLNAFVPGGSYLWQDGSMASSYLVNTAGIYAVTVTANGCSNSDAIAVNYNPIPTVDLGNDTTLCAGQSLLLTAATSGGSYVWQDGSTASTFNVNTPGLYDVDVTVNGCTGNDAIQVNYNALPIVDLGNDTSICAGSPLIIDASTPGGSYLWQDGSSGATMNAAAGGNFDVDVTVNGCTSTDAIAVTVNLVPVVDLGNDTTLCAGQAIILTATTTGGSYIWQDGSTASTFNVNTPGLYDVDVTVNGCTGNDAIQVNYNALPVVDLGNDTSICAGSPLIIDASTPGGSYLWQDGSSGATMNAAAGGNFDVDVTVNSCTSNDAITVTVNPVPVVDLGNDTTVCPGETVMLDVFQSGATYLWQDGSAASNYLVALPGNYSVDVTANGCTGADAITISNHALPVVDLGVDQIVCAGIPVTLNAPVIPGASYTWNDGSTGTSINASFGGWFWVDVTTNGCDVRDSAFVNVVPLPQVALGNDTALCPGDQVLLNATTANAGYLWSDGSTGPSLLAGPGSYSVQVTVNGCSSSDAINIAALPAPVIDLGNDTTLCPGATLLLDVFQPGLSYSWQNSSTAANFLVNAPGNYSVTVSDGSGCTSTDDIDVYYTSPASVDLGPDTTICQGATLVLDVTLPGASYLWSTGATSSFISVTSSGLFTVNVQQGSCSVSDAITVSVAQPPVVALGNDTTLCQGASLTLDAFQPGLSYLWQDGSTGSSFPVSAAGNYTVTVTDGNGCSGTDDITITYASPNAVDLGADTTLCQGATLVLDVTLPGASYLWSTGATSSFITVNGAGNYSVDVFQGDCTVSDAITVSMTPLPFVSLGSDTTLCPGAVLMLDASLTGASYQWQDGSSSSGFLVQQAGNYSVDVTLNGCTASDTITVAYASPSSIDLGQDTAICQGQILILDATLPGSLYQWSTGAGTATITVGNAGNYWVNVSQAGCSVSDSIDVNVLPAPTVDLGSDTTLCAGETLMLDASYPGASPLWSTGSGANSIIVNGPAIYWVQLDLNGCTASDSITVNYLNAVAIDLGNDTALCPGATLLLEATLPGASYLWQDGSTSDTYIATGAGNYSVEVSISGCSAQDAITITALQAPVADLGNDTTLCDGSALLLSAAQPGASYLWQDGSTLDHLQVTQTGQYSVTVELSGCTDADAVEVIFLSPNSVDLGPNASFCPGGSITLGDTIPGATYLWQNGATTSAITVNAAGVYWLQVQVSGCSSTDSIQVSEVPLVTPDLGPDQALCEGDSTVLSVIPNGASVIWSDGSTASTLTVSTTGTYSVQLQLSGCTASDGVEVLFTPSIDAVDLGPDLTVCQGDAAILDATVPGGQYSWSTGAITPQISVSASGMYAVEVTGDCLLALDTVVVTVESCSPSIYLPNTFTPDGDGTNDVFAPLIDGDLVQYELIIFDRWGEPIFSTSDPLQAWDGRLKGTDVPDGVYVWRIAYKAITQDGVEQDRLTGHVTLLR